jgi:hypothetical protein
MTGISTFGWLTSGLNSLEDGEGHPWNARERDPGSSAKEANLRAQRLVPIEREHVQFQASQEFTAIHYIGRTSRVDSNLGADALLHSTSCRHSIRTAQPKVPGKVQ